jgi:hypothetical protein
MDRRVSLFFAYTKPKPTPEWWPGDRKTTNATICDKRGAILVAGDWPFCSGHKPKKREASE